MFQFNKKVWGIVVIMLMLILAVGFTGYNYYLSSQQNEVFQNIDQSNVSKPDTSDSNLQSIDATSDHGQGTLTICKDECGNGICQSSPVQCPADDINCICIESITECPADCKVK